MAAGFRDGAYAKVWEIKESSSGKSMNLKISISSKDKTTGNYKTTFSSWITAAGAAYEKAKTIEKGMKIQLAECNVTNEWDREKKEGHTYFTIFDLNIADNTRSTSARSVDSNSVEGNMEEDPF